MSQAALHHVMRTTQQKRTARVLLLAIATAADDEGVCSLPLGALAQDAGISGRYAAMLMRRLEAAGEVQVQRSAGKVNVYRVGVCQADPRSIDQGLTPEIMIRGETADPRSIDQGLTPEIMIRGETADPRSIDQGLTPEIMIRGLPATPDQLIGGSRAVIGSRESLERLEDQKINRSAAAANNARAHEVEPDLPPRPNVFTLYENAIGGLITAMVADELKLLAQEYPEDWLRDAFREMTLSGGRSLKYVTNILTRWRRDGKGVPLASAKPPQAPPAKPIDPGLIQRHVPQTQSPAEAKQRMIDALALLKPARIGNG